MHLSFKKLSYKSVAAIAVALSLTTGTAASQSVKGQIALPGLPTGIAVNYFTNKVYVAVPSYGGSTDTLQVIDGSTNKVTASVAIPPIGFTVAADQLTNQVFVGGCTLDTNACSVVVVDGASNRVTASIPITQTEGLGIESLAVNPLTGMVYVANASDSEIDVISLHLGRVTGKISLGSNLPFGMALNLVSDQLYVTLGTDQIDVIDLKSRQVVQTGYTGTQNVTVALNQFTGNLFVPNNMPGDSTVAVLTKSLAPLATVAVGNTPYGVDVDFVTNLAFVVNTQNGTLSVINGIGNTVQITLPVTGELVAVNPFTRLAYVTGQDASITVVSEK